MYKKRKRSITLIEMIVVMLLIATITGALAYNYNKSLNEGKAFKTKEGIERITTILSIYAAEHGTSASEIQRNWEKIIANSPLVKDAKELCKDGWGQKYIIEVKPNDLGDFEIIVDSPQYRKYKQQKNS